MKRRHHPADVAARIAVALGGGYAATLFGARAAARVLPMEGAEAAMAASLGAWLLFLAVIAWAFAARGWIAAVAAPLALVILLYLAAR